MYFNEITLVKAYFGAPNSDIVSTGCKTKECSTAFFTKFRSETNRLQAVEVLTELPQCLHWLVRHKKFKSHQKNYLCFQIFSQFLSLLNIRNVHVINS